MRMTLYPFTGDYFACVCTLYPFTGDDFVCVFTKYLYCHSLYAYYLILLAARCVLHIAYLPLHRFWCNLGSQGPRKDAQTAPRTRKRCHLGAKGPPKRGVKRGVLRCLVFRRSSGPHLTQKESPRYTKGHNWASKDQRKVPLRSEGTPQRTCKTRRLKIPRFSAFVGPPFDPKGEPETHQGPPLGVQRPPSDSQKRFI